jgi:hypothetical protein
MKESGYVRYGGRWMLPQKSKSWRTRRRTWPRRLGVKLSCWHGWLDTDKAAAPEANIRAINDPYAARRWPESE